jgi:serine/threonine-protein kinase
MKTSTSIGIMGVAAAALVAGCSSKVEVPRVEGVDEKTAVVTLQSQGLQIGLVQNEFTGTKESGIVLRQVPGAFTRVAKSTAIHLTVEESVRVPGLVGMDFTSAARALEIHGLRLQRLDKQFVGGTLSNVVEQTPAPGSRVAPGSGVDLVLDEFVVVPDCTGSPLADARKLIPQAGLRIGQKLEKVSTSATEGTVLDQKPEAGTKVAAGTEVDLQYAVAVAVNSGKTDSLGSVVAKAAGDYVGKVIDGALNGKKKEDAGPADPDKRTNAPPKKANPLDIFKALKPPRDLNIR